AGAWMPCAAAREVGRLHVMTNATVKIEVTGGPIIYIDPTGINTTPADADFILLTHNHGDHQSTAVMTRLRKPSTVFVSSPPGVPALQAAYPGATIEAVTPGQRFTLGGVEVETVPMYNIVKTGHPRAMNFVGYVLNVGGVRVYHAGDTERIPEMKVFSCDVALLPLGQTFTMNSVQDAVDSAIDLRARAALPIHWGGGEGTLADANFFVAQLTGRLQTMVNTPAAGFVLETIDTVAITSHPASQTIAPGGTVALSVQASGVGTLSYQWRRNGVAVSGATSSTLNIPAAGTGSAGDYTVVVSDANGPVTSRLARVLVATPNAGRLMNVSVRGVSRGAATPLIVGCVVADGAKSMLIRGIGPALTAFGVPGALADPRLDVHAEVAGRDTIVGSNNDWASGGTATLRAAFLATGAFDLTDATGQDAALLTTIEGSRTIHVVDTADRSGVALVEIYDTAPGSGGRLVNVSARNFAGTGANTLIAGFVVSGNVPKRLLIRGIGPRLTGFGVPGALADPKVELYLSGPAGETLFASNDNWAELGAVPARAAFASAGAFDLSDGSSRDAALIVTVPAGAFTAQVSGVGSATGEALVEIYELP
ncbi:MAG TPA: MBL fold metallo-hydrolase, partial [Opitutaceae bacterium]|nr:MBL fold metallo-hydrolase [Opitutaceae bacterium]